MAMLSGAMLPTQKESPKLHRLPQDPDFGPCVQGPGFGPCVRGPGFGPCVRGPNSGPCVRGPGFGPCVRGPGFGPCVRGQRDTRERDAGGSRWWSPWEADGKSPAPSPPRLPCSVRREAGATSLPPRPGKLQTLFSKLLYGMVTAPMSSSHVKKLEVTELKMCRWACGHT